MSGAFTDATLPVVMRRICVQPSLRLDSAVKRVLVGTFSMCDVLSMSGVNVQEAMMGWTAKFVIEDGGLLLNRSLTEREEPCELPGRCSDYSRRHDLDALSDVKVCA